MANLLNIGIGTKLGPLDTGLAKATKKITSFSKGAEKRLNSLSTDRLQKGLSRLDASAVPAANKLSSSLGNLQTPVRGTTQAVVNMNRVIQDAPFGIIGVANNIEPLIMSFNTLKATTGSTTGALKSLITSAFTGPGALITVTSLASTALLVFGDKLFRTKKKTEELDESLQNLNDSWKRVIELQDQFGAFEGDETGVEKINASIREITEEIEEQQEALRRINDVDAQRRDIIANNTDQQGRLTAAGQQQLDVLNETVGNLGSQEQIQLRITELRKEQQGFIEDLVNLGDALADSDTKQAQQAQKTAEAKKRQLEFEKALAEARASVEVQRPDDLEPMDEDIIIPDAELDLGEKMFPEGSLGALQQRLASLRESFKTAVPGTEAFSGLQTSIKTTQERINELQGANKKLAKEGSQSTAMLASGFGRVAGAIISGKEEALSFSGIMSAILPGLLSVLFPGGGAVGGLIGGIFGGAFHDGGVVPGPLGKERLILAQGGETVMTPQQMRRGSGGRQVIENHLYIDGREVELSLENRSYKRNRG